MFKINGYGYGIGNPWGYGVCEGRYRGPEQGVSYPDGDGSGDGHGIDQGDGHGRVRNDSVYAIALVIDADPMTAVYQHWCMQTTGEDND